MQILSVVLRSILMRYFVFFILFAFFSCGNSHFEEIRISGDIYFIKIKDHPQHYILTNKLDDGQYHFLIEEETKELFKINSKFYAHTLLGQSYYYVIDTESYPINAEYITKEEYFKAVSNCNNCKRYIIPKVK